MLRDKSGPKNKKAFKDSGRVRGIVDHKLLRGKDRPIQYLVQWEEDSYADSWVTEDKIEKKHKISDKSTRVDGEEIAIDVEPENGPSESDDEDCDEYEVEAIVSHKKMGDGFIYTVSWVGYPGELTDATEEDLQGAKEILSDYKKKHNIEPYSPKRITRASGIDPKKSMSKLEEIALSRTRRRASTFSDDSNASLVSAHNTTPVTTQNLNVSQRTTRQSSRIAMISPEVNSPTLTTRITRNTRSSTLDKRELPRNMSPQREPTKKIKRTEVEKDSNVTIIGENRFQKIPSWQDDDSDDFDSLNSDSEKSQSTTQSPRRSSDKNVSKFVIPDNAEKLGITNGLSVDFINGYKTDPDPKKCTVRVHYKTPIPKDFNAVDVLPVSFVRYLAPQKLIDHLEQLLHC